MALCFGRFGFVSEKCARDVVDAVRLRGPAWRVLVKGCGGGLFVNPVASAVLVLLVAG